MTLPEMQKNKRIFASFVLALLVLLVAGLGAYRQGRRAATSLDSSRPECAVRRSAMSVRISVSEGLRRQRWRAAVTIWPMRARVTLRASAISDWLCQEIGRASCRERGE